MIDRLFLFTSSLFLILLLLLAYIYLFTPWVIKRKQTHEINASYDLVSPDDPRLSASARQYIAQTTAALLENDFQFLSYLTHSPPNQKTTGFVALFANDRLGQLAQVVFVTSKSQEGGIPITITATGMWFETFYKNGFILQSGTLPRRNVFVPRPNVTSVSFKGYISSVPDLLRIHQYLELQLGHSSICPPNASIDPSGYMQQLHDQAMQLQVSAGRFWR